MKLTVSLGQSILACLEYDVQLHAWHQETLELLLLFTMLVH